MATQTAPIGNRPAEDHGPSLAVVQEEPAEEPRCFRVVIIRDGLRIAGTRKGRESGGQ